MTAARFDASPCPTPVWLPEGHSQTIWAARLARRPQITFARERVDTPDGDFIDIDWAVPGWSADKLNAAIVEQGLDQGGLERLLPGGPARLSRRAIVLFHGLEGSSLSHYSIAMAHHFRARGWTVAIPHFRGCSNHPNRLLRAYHSGDAAEIALLLDLVQRRLPAARWHGAGVSLGGNALARYLGENPDATTLRAAAVISAPLNLTISGKHLGTGFLQRHLYTRLFLKTLKAKVLQKARRFPGSVDAWRVTRARDLYEFDDAYTAPVHGFANVADYWARASALPVLPAITVPTLVLNARNDPFVPASSLPGVHDASRRVLLHQPATGGHVGFVTGSFRGHLHWLPRRVERFFATGY